MNQPTQRAIFLFWAPLAAQWIMMALEGPFLAAIIARAGDPAFNLAAYGVAFAFAILVESPVIMLMSAATAIVEDAASYRRLRNFANALNAGSTALLLVVLVPPVHRFLMITLLGLPAPIAELVYGALWLLLPWPAAIGYRRFLHGVLIRSGRTRLVAYGTMLRLVGMAGAAMALYLNTQLPGAWIGAIALSAGVCTEAAATRVMAVGAIRELLGPTSANAAAPHTGLHGDAAHTGLHGDAAQATMPGSTRAAAVTSAAAATLRAAPGYRELARFYYPLALTSLIGLTVHPLLTFFMGRSSSPVESLAVFPVVHALSFLFRSLAFSFQEAAIALFGRDFENIGALVRFGAALACAGSGGLALVAFTPLAGFWFETVSGLSPDLAAFALAPTRILVPLPAMAVLLAFQQAALVKARRTRPISAATAIEVATIALLFALLGWAVGLVGATAAMIALVGGRLAGNLYLVRPVEAARARR